MKTLFSPSNAGQGATVPRGLRRTSGAPAVAGGFRGRRSLRLATVLMASVFAAATLSACGTKSDLLTPGSTATPAHRHHAVMRDHNPSQPPQPIGQ
jgi:hypothetical protein